MSSDAKSRYEIVEELTSKKTAIQDELAEYEKREIADENNLDQLKRNQQRAKDDLERTQKHQLEDQTALAQKNKQFYAKKKEALNKKLEAYDEAIKTIKAISGGIDKQNADKKKE